jgi:lipopolysaccharide/colanic/teichoic acid biosynthesis glycosyltransferase
VRREAARSRKSRLAVKRGIDVWCALGAGLALSPVLAWVAVAVAATEGLPILFRQQRPGLGGRPFTIHKFRTMRRPRGDEVWFLTDEARITRLGRFLRATSLDELPELWNVLRGDMSIVGPRPLLMEYLDQYTPEEQRRHDMRPGITGWAAVNGRNDLRFEQRLELDVWYVDHWSLTLDLRIIAMTLPQVLRRQSVSTTEDLALGFPLPGVAVERTGGAGTRSDRLIADAVSPGHQPPGRVEEWTPSSSTSGRSLRTPAD